MKKAVPPSPDDPSWALADRCTKFFNVAFGRKLRTSRALRDAVFSALEAGYSEDDVRIAFWVARCLSGEGWLKDALQGDMSPDVILRFKGGTNPTTGKPAKRWLDELTSRASETKPLMVGNVLARLPQDMIEEERALLGRMSVSIEERSKPTKE
jgi:hypothetical protein